MGRPKVLPKRRRSPFQRAMKILSRLVISPKQQLLMIQIGRRIVVVGDAGGQMSPLSEITDSDEAAALVAQLADEKSHQSSKDSALCSSHRSKL